MKKLNKKGFTLAELLIVVAIIAVLAAIAIPIFTSQLDKAKVATDQANIRSGYATVSSTALTDSKTSGTWYLNADGSVTETATDSNLYKCKGTTTGTDVAGQIIPWTAGDSIQYTISGTKITIAKKGS